MKKSTDAHTHSAYGQNSDGYSSQRKDMFESDAKMLAGKEKREMEALFGKKSAPPVNTSSTSKKFEPKSGTSGLPSMFAGGGGGASGTLMSSGSSSTMKVDRNIYDSTTGGARAGRPVDHGSVSKLNMGSAGVMDTSRSAQVDVANRGKFGGSSRPDASISKMNMGSAGVMDTSRSKPVTEANRASFGTKGSSGGAGAAKTVSRDPMSQNGVLRKFAWEQ